MSKIYIIGHKTPDLDSVVSAISYAKLKNKLENTDKYIPSIPGEINQVTKFVLEKFEYQIPELLESGANKKLILLDHNEGSQIIDGYKEAEILEVLDHHNINFNYNKPIEFIVKPLGSTSSIIYEKYIEKNIDIDQNLAGLLLSAVLDDTVITKSPTCTEFDKKIIEELSKIAKIENWQEYGIKMFKIKSNIDNLSILEIIKMDFKDFNLKVGKFGIGQIETADLSEIKKIEDEILLELEKIRLEENYHSVILLATDIIKEGSLFLISSKDKEKLEKDFNSNFLNNKAYIPGIVSRKKQVTPILSQNE